MTIRFNTLFQQRDVRLTPSATSSSSSSTSILAPIGSILPWLKSYTNTPQALPTGWVECDGATVSDADSVYDGQVLPDLNGDNQFPRGNSTSGGTGGESTHVLTLGEIPSHFHTASSAGISLTALTTGGGFGHTGSGNAQHTYANTGTAGSGTAHENKPPYYNVVWIIRIK